MAIEQKTIIDQIEIANGGEVRVRFGLLTIKDGREILRTWHRTQLLPGDDVDANIAAINADITTRPELMAEPVDITRIPLLKSVVGLVHTPEVVQKYQAEHVSIAGKRG